MSESDVKASLKESETRIAEAGEAIVKLQNFIRWGAALVQGMPEVTARLAKTLAELEEKTARVAELQDLITAGVTFRADLAKKEG